MKRSDALKIIDDTYGKFCADWLQVNLDNLDGFVPLNERILNALESAGMLPPLNDWSYHMDGDHADYQDIRYYTWEQENEKK